MYKTYSRTIEAMRINTMEHPIARVISHISAFYWSTFPITDSGWVHSSELASHISFSSKWWAILMGWLYKFSKMISLKKCAPFWKNIEGLA